MKHLQRFVDLVTRAVMWLTDWLGLWRTDVAIYRRHARTMTALAADLEDAGLVKSAAEARAVAGRWNYWAAQRVPARVLAKLAAGLAEAGD